MIRVTSLLNCIVLTSAIATCLFAAGSVRAQSGANAIVCPQEPAGVPVRNVPQAPAPRQAHMWAPYLIQEAPGIRVFKTTRFLARVRQFPTKQVVFLFGTFTLEDLGEISRISQGMIQNKNTIVSFNFGGGTGGAVMAFEELMRAVCDARAGCILRTEVSSGHRCGSFCIALFMMGSVRVADPDAEFGFHSATNGYCKIPGDAEKAYERAGISADWLAQHPQYFFEREVTWLKPAEMVGSNIVTITATKK